MVRFLAGAYLIVTCKYRNNVVSIQYPQPGNKLLTYTKMERGGSRRSSPHFGLRCGDCRGCLFSSTSHRLRYLGYYIFHAEKNVSMKICSSWGPKLRSIPCSRVMKDLLPATGYTFFSIPLGLTCRTDIRLSYGTLPLDAFITNGSWSLSRLSPCSFCSFVDLDYAIGVDYVMEHRADYWMLQGR